MAIISCVLHNYYICSSKLRWRNVF